MNCTACNAELKVGAARCLECGAPIGAAPAPTKREFGDWVKLAIRILQLEQPAVLEASNDPAATSMAVLFVAIAVGAPVIGSMGALLLGVPILLGCYAISYGLIHVAATTLGGKGSFERFVRAEGLSAMALWVNAVPVIGWLFGGIVLVWYLVVSANNVRTVYGLSWPHAAIALALPCLIVSAMVFAGLFVLGASLFAVFR